MKSILATTVAAAFFSVFLFAAASAQAAHFVDDSLVKDLAANGQIVSPHGIWTGR